MIRLARHAEDSPRERSIPTIYTPATREDVAGLSIHGPSWTVGDFLPVGFEELIDAILASDVEAFETELTSKAT